MSQIDPILDEKKAQEAELEASLAVVFARFKREVRRAILDGQELPGPLFSLKDTSKTLNARYKVIQNSYMDRALNGFFLGEVPLADKVYQDLLDYWATTNSEKRGQIISRTNSTQAHQSRSEALSLLVQEEQNITNKSLWQVTGVILARKLRARQKIIAQTEVQAAYESTGFLKSQAIIDTPELNLKYKTAEVWNSVLDGNERLSHNKADGQERVAPDPFDVGGAQLLYPGDPNGPIREIINCRCYLTSKVSER